MDEDGLAVQAREGPAQPAGRSIPARRQWTPLGRALGVAGDKWTLLIAAQLEGGRMRVSELRARLAGVSTGVLDRYVRQMASAGLLTRTRYREMPPRVELELTEAGRELLPIAAALARWGLRRAWSEPAVGEQVDIDALLRLLPVLLAGPTGLPNAELELILHEEVAESRYRFVLRDGRLLPIEDVAGIPGSGLSEDHTAEPTVRIRGDAEAWRAALGPDAQTQRLRVGGEQHIARALLAALHRPDPPMRGEDEVA